MIGLFVAGFIAISAFVGVTEGIIPKEQVKETVVSQVKEKKHYYVKKTYYVVTKKTIEFQ